MPRRLGEALDLIFQFEFFLLQAADFRVIGTRTCECSIYPFLEHSVLFCEFCKMRRHSHQDLLERLQMTGS